MSQKSSWKFDPMIFFQSKKENKQKENEPLVDNADNGEKENDLIHSILFFILGFFCCCIWAFPMILYKNHSNETIKTISFISKILFIISTITYIIGFIFDIIIVIVVIVVAVKKAEENQETSN